ncbi:hypothetical protein MVEN_01868500 [Mycena venus]|uniref:MYND-type domain-containing protein n=1 Tax=Mycena venus TaxID=2733690 RepID=A0A8H7CMF3_9AGAR|nr:hypothetical protein MVEN_01868500 [Mycena venus]
MGKKSAGAKSKGAMTRSSAGQSNSNAPRVANHGSHLVVVAADNKEYEEAPTRFCSMDQCFNYQNLKECSRCKCARYCSVECQRKNWKRHKVVCDHNVGQLELADGTEPVMQRNLRHWVVRFDATLLNACIRGLNLKYEWERIGQGGLMLCMEPRPHPHIGSRWRIQNAGMVRNEDILSILDSFGVADQYREVLPRHAEERARLQKSSGGTADYAQVIIIAGNVGPDALEGDHPPTMRFTPIDVHKGMVARMSMDKYEGDWCQDLKDQVLDDHPLKHVAPGQ